MSKNIPLLTKEVFFYALMLGAGESYLGAYALFLGATPLFVGMIGAAPVALASLGQFLAFYLNQKIKLRLLLLGTLFLEAISFLCLMIPLFYQEYALPSLIISAAFYFTVRNITVPTQNLFFRSTVPAETRGTFSGIRQKQTFLVILVSLLLFGCFLELAKKFQLEFYAYLALLAIAFCSRLMSLIYHRRMEIINSFNEPPSQFSFFDFISRIHHNNFGRFVLLTTIMGFASNIIGGYLAVYFLKQLQLSYLIFGLLISVSWLAQFISVKFWGQLTDKIGNRAIVIVSIYGLALIPALWLFSTNLYWMIFAQIYSGIFWAGYNLAVSEYTFDAVEGKNFVKCQAYQATINSIGVVAAVILSGLFQNYAYSSGLITNPFVLVFACSLALRCLTAFFLTRRINEVKKFPADHNLNLNFRFAGLNIVARANLSFFRKD